MGISDSGPQRRWNERFVRAASLYSRSALRAGGSGSTETHEPRGSGQVVPFRSPVFPNEIRETESLAVREVQWGDQSRSAFFLAWPPRAAVACYTTHSLPNSLPIGP